jgi:site-specific recombinase XerD
MAKNLSEGVIREKERELTLFCNAVKPATLNSIYEYINDQEISDCCKWRLAINLRAFFKWLNENGYSNIPWSAISYKRHSESIRYPVTQDDFNKLDESCHKLLKVGREYVRWHVILHFLWETGVRRDELLSLRRQEFDFANKSFQCKTLKNGKVRVGYYLTDLLPYVFKFKPHDKMFEVSRRQINYFIPKLCKLSGIEKKLTPHSFRHGYVTRLLKNGAPIQDTALLAGHQKLSTTMRYYHTCADELKNTYESFTNPPKSIEIKTKLGIKTKYKLEMRITKNN